MEILRVLPKNLLSRTVGELVSLEHPKWLATGVRDWFAAKYKLNLDEAEHPIDHYPSMAKLFTRKLKAGARPMAEGVVHPCDAVLTQAEVVETDMLIQAKGIKYSIDALLGETNGENANGETNGSGVSTVARASALFNGGSALTYYLCPTDYHRVHAPMDLELEEIVYVPGTLWPVNAWSVARIPSLFTVNERLIFRFRNPLGPVALVMVGATNVGKITATHLPDFVTNAGGRRIERRKFSDPVQVKKGEEIGIFNLGSTVVALYGPGMLTTLPATGHVRLGERCS